MCDLQTLYCYNDGYTVRCRRCGYIQVAFGTSLIDFSPADFTSLLEIMRAISDSEEAQLHDNCKNIAVPTPYPDVNIIFSAGEAFRLLATIEKADTEIKIQSLMKLFE